MSTGSVNGGGAGRAGDANAARARAEAEERRRAEQRAAEQAARQARAAEQQAAAQAQEMQAANAAELEALAPEVREAMQGALFTAEAARQQAARIAQAQQAGDEAAVSAIAADPFAAPVASDDPREMLLDSPPTLAQLQNNPALGPQLQQLASDPDPAVQERMGEIARGLAADAMEQALRDGAGQTPEAVREAFMGQVTQLAALTGLGAHFGDQAEAGVMEAAERLLDEGFTLADLEANPAMGQALGALAEAEGEAAERLRGRLDDLASEALGHALDGQEGDAVEGAVTAFRDRMAAIAGQTGLAGLEGATAAAVEGAAGRIEDQAEAGGPGGPVGWFQDQAERVTDFVAGVVDDATDFVADAFRVVGEVDRRVFDVMGDLGELETRLAANVAQGLGAEDLADDVRGFGQGVNEAYDQFGQMAHNNAEAAASLTEVVGEVSASVIREGDLTGAANDLMDQALGPQIPEFAGQIGGVTGAITNRLDRGDQVFVSLDTSVEVGMGAFAGMRLGGTAALGRNEEGLITLSLEVRGGLSAGLKAELGVESSGTEASLAAEAAVDGDVQATVEMTFDPANPQDVARLQAIFEPSIDRVREGGLNPLGLTGAVMGPISDAMETNRSSVTFGGSVGVHAEAGATLSGGGASIEANVAAEAVAGATQEFRADGTQVTTLMMSASAGQTVRAELGRLHAELGVNADAIAEVAIERDAAGRIVGLSGNVDAEAGVAGEVDVDNRAGVSNEEERPEGASPDFVQDRSSASIGSSSETTETRTVSLEGEALEEAVHRIEEGESALTVFAQLSADPSNVSVEVTTATTDALTLAAGGRVSAGFVVEGEATLTAGVTRSDTQVVED